MTGCLTTQREREQFAAMTLEFLEQKLAHAPREQLRAIADAMLRYRPVCQQGVVLHGVNGSRHLFSGEAA